jgi:endonuclease/exonuclease/phosphatase family metal-dependent hydrolase
LNRFFKSILRLVTIGLALFLLASVATIYISPAKIHLFTFLGFLFPALWIINLFLLIFHVIRGSKKLIIPLVVLALTWNQWNNVFQLSGAKAPEEMNMPVKVMSFNVRMFDFYHWSGLKNTPQAIFDFIRKENPDILCIQEYYTSGRNENFSPNHTRASFRALGYHHVEYRVDKGRNAGYGIATLSKYPIINKGSLHFKESKNMAIFTDVNIKGKIIRVFNNHLESIGFKQHDYNLIDSLRFEMDEQQRQGIKEIVSKMTRAFQQRSSQAETLSKHIRNSPYPVIVCGDFNDAPISYVYRTMRGRLKDSFREAGAGLGGTYNGHLPSLRIDYVFHDQKFDSYNFKRYNVDYSDHYPISAIIELEPNTK